MRIAVNTRFLIRGKMEGFGWYTYEVFKRIVTQHPEHEFIFIFDRPFDPSFVFSPNVTAMKTIIPARHPLLFDWHFNHAIPKLLKKFKADVFVSPDGYLSLNTDIKQIAVIHDLNFEHYPNDLKPNIIKYYRSRFPKFAKKACQIITVSEYSKNDIAKCYGIEKSKITVSPNGADEEFIQSGDLGIAEFKTKYNIGSPYFLAVGSIHPRKNIKRLLEAFDKFKLHEKKEKLIIVGDKYQWTDEMKSTYENLKFKNDVVFTGHLNKTDLVKAYSGALALIFPSYFEGFGIPLVEAMRCNCPVVCANATSFPEVAGNAALYFDPFDIASISNAMLQISENDNLRNNLIALGSKKVMFYNWQNTADIVWKTIEKTFNA